MTYSYNALVKIYQEQRRLNKDALRMAFGLKPPRFEDMTLKPCDEFSIDTCVEVDAHVGSAIKGFGDLLQSPGGTDHLHDIVTSSAQTVANVWRGQGRPIPDAAIATAQARAFSYVHECLYRRWLNNLTNSIPFRTRVYEVGAKLGCSRVELAKYYAEILGAVTPKQVLEDEDIKSAIRAIIR